MTARRIHLQPRLCAGFAAVRRELAIREEFPRAALVEAEQAAAAPLTAGADLTDLPFFTIDPPASRDLDQAMHLERHGGGFRVRYAIADVAAFVTPGGALDRAVWDRGVTYYSPDRAIPLHPPVLAAGAASLLPDQVRPAIVWTLDLDVDGALTDTRVARARVRSHARYDYATAQQEIAEQPFALLAEIGRLRQERERARGGVHLPLPEQEVVEVDGGWSVAYRAPLPVEGYNAQISLLTGMAAAEIMLANGVGILRVVREADDKALRRLRRSAAAFGVHWPDEMSYPAFVRSLDPEHPIAAALLHDATSVMRGASYAGFDGEPPELRRHAAIAADYAHVTAPLRRLADRYALECCLDAPQWAREALEQLPATMREADQRANKLERAAVDLVEAVLLEAHVGETFSATVIDDGLIQLRDPAVRAKCDGDPPVANEIRARLVEADPESRSVRFEVV